MIERLYRLLGVSLAFCGAVGCARHEQGPPPAVGSPVAPEVEKKAPGTSLLVKSHPLEPLRSPYFTAMELTFENPSNQWRQVRRVFLGPERQVQGPQFDVLVGERLRVWQLAAREAHVGGAGPHLFVLETLAPEEPAQSAEKDGPSRGGGTPPTHLLSLPFSIAPGLSTTRWVVLFSSSRDALIGQDLVLEYELENAFVERVLINVPMPEPAAGKHGGA
jgi:hypothetical protein